MARAGARGPHAQGEPAVVIEDAREQDLVAMVAIYNEVIATSTAIFSEQPVTVEERAEQLRRRRANGQPVLVARCEDEVVGFASYGEFRPWPGYRLTVEHSVHIAAAWRRRGIGGQLVAELLERARAAGMHVMVAGIDRENEASLRLHRRLGFEQVGVMSQVARKFDRWVDLALLQITL